MTTRWGAHWGAMEGETTGPEGPEGRQARPSTHRSLADSPP